MVDGIDLYTKKLSRHGSCHASREVVHIELDFHFELSSFVFFLKNSRYLLFSYRGDWLELKIIVFYVLKVFLFREVDGTKGAGIAADECKWRCDVSLKQTTVDSRGLHAVISVCITPTTLAWLHQPPLTSGRQRQKMTR